MHGPFGYLYAGGMVFLSESFQLELARRARQMEEVLHVAPAEYVSYLLSAADDSESFSELGMNCPNSCIQQSLVGVADE